MNDETIDSDFTEITIALDEIQEQLALSSASDNDAVLVTQEDFYLFNENVISLGVCVILILGIITGVIVGGVFRGIFVDQ